MKFVVIFGPQAVGKMTVGHALVEITGLKLFHNHMTIDLVAPLFGYGSGSPVGSQLVNHFREKIFEAFAKSDQEGLIFTYLWALDDQRDWQYIEQVCAIFRNQGAAIFFVELDADLEERIKRNKTPHRLQHKPSKRNIEWSEQELIESANSERLHSKPGEIKEQNYIKINNTNLSPQEVANIIKDTFYL